MKTNVHFVVAGLLVAFIGLVIGCSDLKDTLPPATQTTGVHPEGWLTKTSADFHGKAVQAKSWDMRSCKTCHGDNYDGGTVQVSCLTCHTDSAGPENCATCHGSSSSPAPPRDLGGNSMTTARGVGAHQVHLNGTSRSKAATCAECHAIPAGVYTSGHIDGDNRAEVVMTNYLANLSTGNGSVNPTPSYNNITFACSNTYCHGTFKNGNMTNVPVWNASSTGACGTCHGNASDPDPTRIALPGGTHPNNTACSSCHGGVINASRQIINASKHVDGRLNLSGNDQTF